MKPMLLYRSNPDLTKLPYPVKVYPKLDGIRCLARDGVALSRTLKPIPNKHIQLFFTKHKLHGLDGELIVGSPTATDVFRQTTSVVMSNDKDVAQFCYYVFDLWDRDGRIFLEREEEFHQMNLENPGLKILNGFWANNAEDVIRIEKQVIEQGYEGVIIRVPSGKYKFGRTTEKENNTFKYKRFEDSEAVVIGMEPELFNNNEAKISNTGNIERSTHKANMIPKASMGALVLRDDTLGWEFQCGSGFTAEERIWWYHNWKDVADKKLAVTYKFFNVGVKDKPRHPIFKGIRSKDDM